MIYIDNIEITPLFIKMHHKINEFQYVKICIPENLNSQICVIDQIFHGIFLDKTKINNLYWYLFISRNIYTDKTYTKHTLYDDSFEKQIITDSHIVTHTIEQYMLFQIHKKTHIYKKYHIMINGKIKHKDKILHQTITLDPGLKSYKTYLVNFFNNHNIKYNFDNFQVHLTKQTKYIENYEIILNIHNKNPQSFNTKHININHNLDINDVNDIIQYSLEYIKIPIHNNNNNVIYKLIIPVNLQIKLYHHVNFKDKIYFIEKLIHHWNYIENDRYFPVTILYLKKFIPLCNQFEILSEELNPIELSIFHEINIQNNNINLELNNIENNNNSDFLIDLCYNNVT